MDKSDRALPNLMPELFNTAYDCSITCYDASFQYSGHQSIRQCWCGNSGYDKYGSSNKCNDCNSANVGGWLSCVYEAVTRGPTFKPTNLPSLEASDVPTALPSYVSISMPSWPKILVIDEHPLVYVSVVSIVCLPAEL